MSDQQLHDLQRIIGRQEEELRQARSREVELEHCLSVVQELSEKRFLERDAARSREVALEMRVAKMEADLERLAEPARALVGEIRKPGVRADYWAALAWLETTIANLAVGGVR